MLTLSHVSKSYGKFPAVEDISLEMEHGLYGMLAPNGAGKTTLIKMIATLLVPTQGEILWDGIPVAKLGEKYRDLLGYLPQQFGYYKNNTPVQYLDYLAALKNMPKQTAKEKIEQLLELVGLSDVADKKMKKLLGLVFLVAAALVLYFGSVGWPSLDVNLWSLIPVGLFLYFTLENFLKKDYKASLMCLIIAFIIANAIFDLLPISSGLVIGAGVLACVGLGYLFPDKDKKEGK